MPVKWKDFSRREFERTKKALAREMMRIGLRIEKRAKESMVGGGLPHTPSAPGDPPHVDTGRLRSSITTEQTIGDRVIVVRVGTNVKYGLWLELGTRDIDPRPWLRPAFMSVVSEAN